MLRGAAGLARRPVFLTRRRRRAASLLAAVLGLAAALPAAGHDPSQHGLRMVVFDPPFPAPAFVAAALGGGERRLADFRGRLVLLNFWATWCPPCVEEMPSMEALHQAYRTRGFTVLAVSSDADGARAVAPFVEKLGVTFPVLLDPSGEVAARYGARNLPVSFLLDAEGRVVAAAQGARDWASPQAREVVAERLPGR